MPCSVCLFLSLFRKCTSQCTEAIHHDRGTQVSFFRFSLNKYSCKNKTTKELTKFHAVKRFLHEVIESQKMTGENGMELCTINLNKDAVSNCKTYTEEIYDECISKLRACETKVYEEEDVLGLLNSNPVTRYRYFVLWTT